MSSIQARIRSLLFSFFVLIAVSVGVTFWGLDERSESALRWVQIVFLLCAVGLLGAGRLIFHHTIVAPLKRLKSAAGRIRAGDLQTPVEVSGPEEIRALANDLEDMRVNLEHSHQQLTGWAQELENRVEQRTQELDVLYEVGREISARLDLPDVLQSITGRARELLQAETSFLCLLDAHQQNLRLQATSGPANTVSATSTPAQNPFVQGIFNHPGTQLFDKRICQDTCGMMAKAYRASHQAVPLCLEGRIIGSLCVGHRQEKVFSEEDLKLLERMGSVAAVALENARLYEQAERIAALEERQRIAASIHDGVAQIIDSLGLLVDQANEALEMGKIDQAEITLERVRGRISQASMEVRQSIASLQDEPAQTRGLHEQLRALIHTLSPEFRPVRWEVELDRSLTLSNEDTQQVLGIAREALSNALRHSQASRVRVCLGRTATDAHLTIEDNGCGFDPAAGQTDGRKHFGLKILAARAARMRGSLEVHSSPGGGTCVSLTWPVPELNLPFTASEKELNEAASYSPGRRS